MMKLSVKVLRQKNKETIERAKIQLGLSKGRTRGEQYWEGYIQAKKEDRGLLDEQEKELNQIIVACEQQPIQGKNAFVHLRTRKETCEEFLG